MNDARNTNVKITNDVKRRIDLPIKEKRKKLYADELALAAKDSDFIKRTLDSQKEFDRLEFCEKAVLQK